MEASTTISIDCGLPYPFTFNPHHTALVSIDMQRDFIDEGGFGSMLGNDVSLLKGIVPTVQTLLQWARRMKLMIIHTRESHLADLSDCPTTKRKRGKIGDQGPMGRILIRREP
ncbi:unnamed protein product, partial [Didymodactylos carnosus]